MLSNNQKIAMRKAIDYYTNPAFSNWYAVKIDNKYKKGNTIIFSNQNEKGSLYFKVMNNSKMLYIGIIYNDNIANNYECVGYFENQKVVKRAKRHFDELGEKEYIL